MPILGALPLKAGNTWQTVVKVIDTGPQPLNLNGFSAAAVLLDNTGTNVIATLKATVVPDAVAGGLIYVDATPADTAALTEGIYLLVVQMSNPATKYVREFDPKEVSVTRNLIPSPF